MNLEVILQNAEVEKYCEIEEYNKVENDAFNIYNDTTAKIANR